MATTKKTVMQVLDAAATKEPDAKALAWKTAGTWEHLSWREYRAQIRIVARAFMKLGLERGQGVSILGFNRREWVVADLAAIWAGGFPAGIYTTSSAEQCRFIADHSDSAIAVVENEEQLAKIVSVRSQLPKLKAIVLMSGRSPDAVSWSDLATSAEAVSESELDERIRSQSPDDTCTLIYTSGTTGTPKAVMISHDNLTYTAESAIHAIGAEATAGMRVLSYLPLSHIAEQIISVHGPMVHASCTYFAESMDKLPENLREVRPTLFLGVPRVWEKIQAKMQATAAKNSGLKKRLAAWARGVGLRGGYATQEGRPLPFFYPLADKLVFSKVRKALGLDECKFAVTSAAPISKSTLEFFLSLGIPIMEVYGMSECTGPATLSLPKRYHTGKVGFTLPGTEIKTAEDGEICMRGRHVFKGYYKAEEATREALDADGWLHSGDVGVLDSESFVTITDRKKDLLITAGGENIAPQVLEGQLKAIAVVNQVVVIGDRRKFLTALLSLDEAKLPALIEAAGSDAKDVRAASTCPKVREQVMRDVEVINATLARVQTIKRIHILPGELTVEGGELTPTLKVKRKAVNEKYADVIEAMYA